MHESQYIRPCRRIKKSQIFSGIVLASIETPGKKPEKATMHCNANSALVERITARLVPKELGNGGRNAAPRAGVLAVGKKNRWRFSVSSQTKNALA
jgi:hypothetical protein